MIESKGYEEVADFNPGDFYSLFESEILIPSAFEVRAIERQVAKLVLGEPSKPKQLRRRSPNRVTRL